MHVYEDAAGIDTDVVPGMTTTLCSAFRFVMNSWCHVLRRKLFFFASVGWQGGHLASIKTDTGYLRSSRMENGHQNSACNHMIDVPFSLLLSVGWKIEYQLKCGYWLKMWWYCCL